MTNLLATHWFEIVLSALTLVLGAVLGPAIERLVLGARSVRFTPVQSALTIQQAINITTYHVESPSPKPSPSTTPRTSTDNDDNEWVWIAGLLVLAFVATATYLRYRTLVLTVLIVVMTFGVATSISALIYLARQGFIVGWPWSITLLWAVVLFLTAPVNVYLLLNPVFHTGRYEDLIRAFERGRLREVIGKFDVDGVFFVFYQVLGVVAFLGMAYLLLAGLLFLWSSVNLAIDARGYRLWAFVRRVLLTTPGKTASGATILAIISLLMCSGVVANWISRLSGS
jgi:hypothetical protein